MLEIIVYLLNTDHHYGISEDVDIAKGFNKIPVTLKEGWDQIQRKRKWQRR